MIKFKSKIIFNSTNNNNKYNRINLIIILNMMYQKKYKKILINKIKTIKLIKIRILKKIIQKIKINTNNNKKIVNQIQNKQKNNIQKI